MRTGFVLTRLSAVRPACATDGFRLFTTALIRDRDLNPSSALQDLYQLLYQLTTVTGQQRYVAAADAALTFFLASTAAPESGLLPWGAYAQWDFRRDTWARGA